MAYRFKRTETVSDAIRRIADEQLDLAMGDLDHPELPNAEAIHQVRKRCKKLRGLIRLVRPALDVYQAENAAFRDAARLLSGVRDAQVYVATCDRIIEHFDRQLRRDAFGSIREQLSHVSQTIVDEETDLDRRLERFRSEIAAAQQRVAGWTLDDEDYDAVGGGLAKTYDRARKAVRQCSRLATVEDFHEYRKRVKYHWYHCRLLHRIWPPVIHLRQRQAHRLSDWLGDAHDLAVLSAQIEKDRAAYGAGPAVEAFLGLLQQRRKEFEDKSLLLGKKLFAESGDALATRFGRYWKVWKS